MNYVNATPHVITVYNEAGQIVASIPPSGIVARCAQHFSLWRVDVGIPLYRATYGAVESIPVEAADTIIIVSAMVRAALPERYDLASPGELVRDGSGRPVGCRGLVLNI